VKHWFVKYRWRRLPGTPDWQHANDVHAGESIFDFYGTLRALNFNEDEVHVIDFFAEIDEATYTAFKRIL
jgi:hypothetical protein